MAKGDSSEHLPVRAKAGERGVGRHGSAGIETIPQLPIATPTALDVLATRLPVFGNEWARTIATAGLENYASSMMSGVTAALEQFRESLQFLRLGRGRGEALDPENSAYSPEMSSSDTYFRSAERSIGSFDELHEAIQHIVAKNPSLTLLWRGQRRSDWGLHSSLFRALMVAKGVRSPEKAHRSIEPYPTEEQMVEAERRILEIARRDWRLEGMSALECFARLQHFGAPTRLLDVSRNPYIAAWFAVESLSSDNGRPGRLFALATHPVPADEAEKIALENVARVDGVLADGALPFWHAADSNKAREALGWGTGAVRRFWVPPIYEQRILAQNGAFVIDGVPLSMTGLASYFRKPGPQVAYWKRADLLAASSIYTKIYSTKRRVAKTQARRFPPTFSYVITPEGKDDIRKNLEGLFSYSVATMYPDIEGLALHVRRSSGSLIK